MEAPTPGPGAGSVAVAFAVAEAEAGAEHDKWVDGHWCLMAEASSGAFPAKEDKAKEDARKRKVAPIFGSSGMPVGFPAVFAGRVAASVLR